MTSPMTFDLRTPPDRQELGLEEGEQGYTRSRGAGEDLLAVTVELADTTLTTDAMYLLQARASGAQGAPTSFTVFTRVPTDDAAAELRSVGERLGMDPVDVSRGVEVISRETATITNSRYLPAPDQGEIGVEVGVSRDQGQDDVVISYGFTWGEGRPVEPTDRPRPSYVP